MSGRVCILLGLYNGARDLDEQLTSFLAQSWAKWDLLVSDDGSHDMGPDMVHSFGERAKELGHEVRLLPGPQRGFAANFISLLRRAPAQAEWLALSDQDDKWLPERLERGVRMLQEVPADMPGLYCSRTWITDDTLEGRRLSRLPAQPTEFANALIQNVAAGNTILLNKTAATLLRDAATIIGDIKGMPAHDWWVYQMITGANGRVIFDPEPTLLYRQHSANLIGANDGWRAHLRRLFMVLRGQFATWNDSNIAVLRQVAPLLSPQANVLVEQFAKARQKRLFPRIRAFRALGLYRQTRPAQMTMWLAIVLGKI